MKASEKLVQWWKPGNLIYLSYWRSFDKVLSYDPVSGDVTVVEISEKTFEPIAAPRTHRTHPEDRDMLCVEDSGCLYRVSTWREFLG